MPAKKGVNKRYKNYTIKLQAIKFVIKKTKPL